MFSNRTALAKVPFYSFRLPMHPRRKNRLLGCIALVVNAPFVQMALKKASSIMG